MTYDDNASFWIQIIREGLDPLRRQLTDEAVLREVGDVTGKVILDAGCGEGYLSRRLARQGAQVRGVDPSGALLEAAESAAIKEGLVDRVLFSQAYMDQLPYDDGTFDVCLCNHSLNDVEKLEESLGELARVLRPLGRLVMLTLHPCFYDLPRGRVLDAEWTAEYFDGYSRVKTFTVAGRQAPAGVRAWFRPLESYVAALRRNGLVLTGLSEPHPSAELMHDDPWWRDKFSRPLFLLMTARPAPTAWGGR